MTIYDDDDDGTREGQENNDDFPEAEVKTLLSHGLLRTRAMADRTWKWYNVRIYVLPDDVARGLVPQRSSALRRALKTVMAKIDRSTEAWEGRRLARRRRTIMSSHQMDVSAARGEEDDDESLWYIFNSLQDPCPNVETMKDPYAKQSMEDLLSVPAPGDAVDDEVMQGGAGGGGGGDVVGLKSKLYPYQRRSAATMVQREAQPAQMLDPRVQVFTSPTGREYYQDREEGSLLVGKRLYSEACGGILSETMGCGKTLICLSLILATRGHFPRIPVQYQKPGPAVRERTGSLVEMSSAAAGRWSLPWKSHFDYLSGRLGMSFPRCVEACDRNRGSYTIPPPQSRVRRNSSSSMPPTAYPPPALARHLRLCWGTLIIVPGNLVDHWQGEIARHTEGLNVITFRHYWEAVPAAEDLMKYDIVLFAKSRFEREAGESITGANCRGATTTDHRNGTMMGDSPLTELHWLRIIVDEGHNAAGHGQQKSNMSRMLNKLQVERRWVVSGTPSTGLYGVEVSLASQEEAESAAGEKTELPEAASILLHERRKTGDALNNELKDLEKLRLLVTGFLEVKPWSNSRGDDQANWTKYVKTVDANGRRRKAPSLRATLQSLVVRHRLPVVHQEVPLPKLHNKVVYLEPTFYDKLSINLFLFGLAVNAVTSERQDQDYMFHPRNRKHLSATINNLRQAGFWWAGSEMDITATVDIALRYLERGRDKVSAADVQLLTDGIRIGRKALDSRSRNAFVNFQELGIYVQGFPSHARQMWALETSSVRGDPEPLLLGISQARMAQKFVTSRLGSSGDPGEGLAGAGIKAHRELDERAEAKARPESASPGSSSEPSGPSPRKKPAERSVVAASSPSDNTFAVKSGGIKALSPESPLVQTKIVGTASAKLSYLLSRVIELHKEEKIIIFYDSANSAFWIAEGLDLLGINFRIYAGTLRADQKTAYLSLFLESEDVRVLLMDLRQASHGLHLANASRVFIVNPIWQANMESQAIKRAHRIGQTRPVFVETLVLKDTLEDKILKRRKEMSDNEKQDAERDLLDDNIMNSIIQNEPFIPMSMSPGDDDEEERLTGSAPLAEPTGFFDRHKLIPQDEANSDTNNAGARSLPSPSRGPALEKRKQVRVAFADVVSADPAEPAAALQNTDGVNFGAKAKRRKVKSCAVRFVD